MKIAVATQQGGRKDQVSQVVGRAPTFTIVDTKDGKITETEIIQNQSAQAKSGAGIQAAQILAEENIQALIGGNFGPNLADVLTQSGIEMYQAQGLTVENAVQKLLQDQLNQATGATGPAGKGKGSRGGGRRSSQGKGGRSQGGQAGGSRSRSTS